MSEDLCFMPATEMAARIRRRALSPVEAVEAFLTRIGSRNRVINAYVTVIADQARAAARAAERAVMSGAPLGPLHGLPIAIKDLYDFKAGVRNTFGAIPSLALGPDGTLLVVGTDAVLRLLVYELIVADASQPGR